MTQKNYLPETWFHPNLEQRTSPVHGQGQFATDWIREGETVMIWGGTLYTGEDLKQGRIKGPISYSYVEEDLVMAAPEDGRDYYINHSCDPNLWMADNVTVTARRDIAPGEEISGDYAVWEGEPEYTLGPCNCGSPLCRITITGNDWMLPELQERYKGHFLPFITKRIEQRLQSG